jgi:S-adenosylhomocysteine hydrolase
VLRRERFEMMHDGAILANAGHFSSEKMQLESSFYATIDAWHETGFFGSKR